MKNKVITISFVVMIELFFLLSLVIKDEQISKSERRKLAQFPNLTINKIMDGSFTDDFENYTLDQFPFRDTFRSIKANTNYFALNMLDNNSVYLNEQGIFKMDYPTNIESINNFVNKINSIIDNLSKDNKVYSLIIPDKNYYVKEKLFLKIDYDLLYSKIKKLHTIPIDIRNIMDLNDYYKTDTHWKQENLNKVVKSLSEVMGLPYTNLNYKHNNYPNFYGVYYGRAALKGQPDTITYLTNDIINKSTVEYLENPKLNTVYNPEKLTGMDSYDVFLDGASSFITINNPNCKENRELVVFRDSFGSSLITLLIPYYSKITVIDIRYITSNLYLNKVEFTNQDVLFLYSTLLVNDSSSLKD